MQHTVTLTFNPTVDAASEADVVHPTHKIRTMEESFHPGGGGINVARVIKRLGSNVTAVYARGGIIGTVLDHLLEKHEIDRRVITISGNTRINNVIHENSTGLEYRFIAKGPIFSDDEWQSCVKICEDLEWNWLVVSGSLPSGVPVKVYDYLIKLAHERKASVVIDTSGTALRHVMAHGGATLIKPSQGEFEASTQRSYTSFIEIADMAQALVKRGVSKIVAVTLGHHGAILATKKQKLYLPAQPVKVFSASGAGDSFIGGMVHALANNNSVGDAFKLGMACGSAAVMEKGTDLCLPHHIKQLYQNLSLTEANMDALPTEFK
ncbi:MAG: 6-phosphofructokinase 2 [Candidatus Tokpelaia sp. JSC188]|nr:MAG: 6-phosphofructokinase 2 [Candidatus Tokpelaia sp. JSC188]